MQAQSLTIGTKVSYEDMANPRCEGVICDIETTRWGTQYVIAWNGCRAGEVTTSDCRQAGWRVYEGEPGWTPESLHADNIRRGVVRVNTQRWEGMYCVLVPDPDVVGRWNTIASYKSVEQAEAFAAGYCAHRDGRVL